VAEAAEKARTGKLTADEPLRRHADAVQPRLKGNTWGAGGHQPAAGGHPAHGLDRQAAVVAALDGEDTIVIRPVNAADALLRSPGIIDGVRRELVLYRVRELLEFAEQLGA
jgi:hypothetical protein